MTNWIIDHNNRLLDLSVFYEILTGEESCDGVTHYQVIGFARTGSEHGIMYQCLDRDERDAYFKFLTRSVDARVFNR